MGLWTCVYLEEETANLENCSCLGTGIKKIFELVKKPMDMSGYSWVGCPYSGCTGDNGLEVFDRARGYEVSLDLASTDVGGGHCVEWYV